MFKYEEKLCKSFGMLHMTCPQQSPIILCKYIFEL